MGKQLKKRKWVYVQKPVKYEMSCDKCEGINIEWSEYERMIWCYDCEIDTLGNAGIFDGPIPIGAASLFGMSFDKFCLKTKRLLKMKIKEEILVWEPASVEPEGEE